MGAVNPADVERYGRVSKQVSGKAEHNFRGQEQQTSRFTVHVSAPSLYTRHVPYFDFDRDVEERFVTMLLRTQGKKFGLNEHSSRVAVVTAAILLGQATLRSQMNRRDRTNIHVSLSRRLPLLLSTCCAISCSMAEAIICFALKKNNQPLWMSRRASSAAWSWPGR